MAYTLDELRGGKKTGGYGLDELKQARAPAPVSQPTPAPQPTPSIWQKIGGFVSTTAKRVGTNIRDLPAGLDTAVNAPFLISLQKRADDLATKDLTDIQHIASSNLPTYQKKLLIEQKKPGVTAPDIIAKSNPKVTEEDYAKRIGGTFFDVATLPTGGAEVAGAIKSVAKGAVKVGVKQVLKTTATRAAEGAAFGGVRAISQGENTKEVAKQAGVGAVLGGVLGGVEGGFAARKANKIASELPKAVTGNKSKIFTTSTISPEHVDTARLVDTEATDFKNIKSIKFTNDKLVTPETKSPTFSNLDLKTGQLTFNLQDFKTMAAEDGYKTPDDLRRYLKEEVLPFESQHVDNYNRLTVGELAGKTGNDVATMLDNKAKLPDVVAEQSTQRQAENLAQLEAANEPKVTPAQAARDKLNQHVENQGVQYESAQNTLDLANSRLDNNVSNLKLLIQNEERRKTGMDVTKIHGLDDYTQMLREATGNPDLSTNDLVDYIKALPTQKDIEKLKPVKLEQTPAGPKKVRQSVNATKPAKPVGTGEVKQSKLYQRTKSDLRIFEGTGEGEPSYRVAHIDDQAKRAADFVSKDYDNAIAAARGEKPLPKVLPNAVYSAIANEALDRGEFELADEMARKMSLSSTAKGQDISFLRSQTGETPVGAMADVVSAQTKALEKRTGQKVGKLVDNTVKEVQVAIKQALPTKSEWHSLLDEITCK